MQQSELVEIIKKPPDVMARQFSWCPEALSNTMEVAERCDLKLKFCENHFPIFPVPEGESLESIFAQTCRDGLEKRLDLLRELQEVSPELEMEISVIQKMGFSGYFLIVADFINWAKSISTPAAWPRTSFRCSTLPGLSKSGKRIRRMIRAAS